MDKIFNIINNFFSFAGIISDFLWEFPTNFVWYKQIPIIGNFQFSIFVLVFFDIYFFVKLKKLSLKQPKKLFHIIFKHKETNVGISNYSSFMLQNAMRIGSGNIVGVTSAMIIGGPGTIFWMWVSTSFGITTAFVEGVLSQIFKEQYKEKYIGGLMSYGKNICNNNSIIGILLVIIYIFYSLFCLPIQGFNVLDSINNSINLFENNLINIDSNFNVTITKFILSLTAILVFGGLHRVVRFTNIIVPFMVIVYIICMCVLIVFNIDKIPMFFKEVFLGSFSVRSIFGGVIGLSIFNGFKRGLMSNEAGQGTLTIGQSLADSNHPVEMGFISSFSVFLDTFIICSLTGFVVVISGLYLSPNKFAEWNSYNGLKAFLFAIDNINTINFNSILKFLLTLCYGLFSYTTLLSMIQFVEISVLYINKKQSIIILIRLLAIFISGLGIICNVLGFRIDNLWDISDLANILLVYINILLLIFGFVFVKDSIKDYQKIIDKN